MCFDRGSQKRKLDNFLIFFQVCLVLYFFLELIDNQITQYYVLCKEPMPMDVEFMVTDSLEAIRPKLALSKNIEDAAAAVDEMFASSTVQGSGRGYPRFRCVHVILTYFTAGAGEGSGDDSGDEGERPTNDEEEDEDEDETGTINSLVGPSHSARAPFPFPLCSPTSVARLQNRRSSSRHPKKSSALTRKRTQSLPRSSRNSSQIPQQNHARSTGAPRRRCGSLLSCHRECVSGTKKATAPLRA